MTINQWTLNGGLVEQYKNVAQAARVMNVNESTIRKAIKFDKNTCGYKWTKEDKNVFISNDVQQQIEILQNKLNELQKTNNQRYITDRYNKSSKNGNVLIVGDLHLPFTTNGYLDFCIETKKKFNCDDVVFIGDIVDQYSNSRWNHDPEGMSAIDEHKKTLECVKEWYNAFPEAIVIFGNHDTRMFKQAFIAGIPKGWIKDFEEIYQMPKKWKCTECIEIDGVMYSHGDGCNGDLGALNKAKERRQSCVIGHGHSFAGVRFLASQKDTIFGMNVGCAVDEESYALAYAKFQDRRPVISCGVVLDYGKQPIVVKM